MDGWGRRFIGDSLEQTGKAERDAGNEQKARKGNAIRESALDDMLKLDSVIAYIKKVNADVDYASEGPYPKSRDRVAAFLFCDDICKFATSGTLRQVYKTERGDVAVSSLTRAFLSPAASSSDSYVT